MQLFDSGSQEDEMQALEVIKKCTELYPKNSSFWATYLDCKIKSRPDSTKEILDLFHVALKSVNAKVSQ